MGERRLALVEDHALMLEALEGSLRREGYDVVASVRSVGEFEALVPELEVDIVLTDLALTGGGSGVDVARIALAQLQAPVLLMTGQGDVNGLTAAITGGCAGFLSKTAPLATLVDAIERVAAGGTWFPRNLVERAAAASPVPTPLSDRELAVLRRLASGQNVQEIADELFLSVHTVRNHVRAVLRKLNARSQLEAVVVGVRAGLVEIV